MPKALSAEARLKAQSLGQTGNQPRPPAGGTSGHRFGSCRIGFIFHSAQSRRKYIAVWNKASKVMKSLYEATVLFITHSITELWHK